MRTLLVLALLVATAVAPFPPIPAFNCPALPKPAPATHVRQLRPGNIKAVMAIGDSISAGFAMQGEVPASFSEYRLDVFDIGANAGAKTIHNFLKVYNSGIQGGATGQTLPLTKGAWLDAAVSGARLKGWQDQLPFLVKQLRNTYKTVDFANDWKLLTVFMGANDLCGVCHGDVQAAIAAWEVEFRNFLTALNQQMPRVFVNVMGIFNISGVWDVAQKDLYCKSLWSILKKECSCLQSGKAPERAAMDLGSKLINEAIYRVSAEWAAKNLTSFHVVVQPGLIGARIPDFGRPFLSNLDCFHPSLQANQAFAYQLWNNMMEPLGKKTSVPDPSNIKYKCPGPNDFLQ